MWFERAFGTSIRSSPEGFRRSSARSPSGPACAPVSGYIAEMAAPPRALADQALIERSLLRVDDALRLVELLQRRMGDRLLRDPYGEPDPLLFVRERAHPDWVAPEPLVAVDMDIAEPEPPRFADPETEAWFRQIEAQRVRTAPEPMPSRVRRSARITLRCGAASWQLVYGKDGMRRETTRSVGPSGPSEEPYVLAWGDGRCGGQPPPLPLFVRPELDPAGHSPDELAAWVAELDPTVISTRVKMPVPAPGGIGGVHWRAQRGLRLALWSGAHAGCGGAPVWLVADGLTGETQVAGSTFDEAISAFDAHLDTVTVLPPPLEPAPEPLISQDPEQSEWTDDNGTKHIEMRATLVIVPKNLIPWPPPGKEHVPAAAFRLQWDPVVPEAWRALGFTRVLPLVGEYGQTGWSWVRDEPKGALVLGRLLAERLDPARFEEAMAEALGRWERERADFPLPDWELDPSWVWHHWSFGLQRDGEGERLVLQGSGVGAGIDPGTFEPALEQQILRWERREPEEG
jgi:hypothetical protein